MNYVKISLPSALTYSFGVISRLSLAGSALLCLSFAAAPAFADTPQIDVVAQNIRLNNWHADVVTQIVRFRDLNLQSDEGVAMLYQRLVGASQLVCAPLPDARELKMRTIWATCQKTALSRAVAEVDQPRLYQLVARMRHEPTTGLLAANH